MTDKKTILIVEDETDLRNLYESIFTDAGYQTILASNGSEAYEKLKSVDYDLCLLDIVMPIFDGLTVLKKLREDDPEISFAKVILLTSLGQNETIAEAVGLGVKGYIVKSDYNPPQLLEEIRRHLS